MGTDHPDDGCCIGSNPLVSVQTLISESPRSLPEDEAIANYRGSSPAYVKHLYRSKIRGLFTQILLSNTFTEMALKHICHCIFKVFIIVL